MKHRKLSIVCVIFALAIVMTKPLSVNANYNDYSTNTSDPTFTVKASLQAIAYASGNAFRGVYAGCRFDAITTRPTYTVLDMTVTVAGTGLTPAPAASGTVTIGNYIGTNNGAYTDIPQNNGSAYLTGKYTANVPGSYISFNPPDTFLSVFDPN